MLLDVWEAHANQDIYILIRLFYFTAENFFTCKVFFFTKFEPTKIPFSIRKFTIVFILILIFLLEYEYNTKETFLSDYKMILLKIKIPWDRYISCSKVF